jgi:hypothetical protein
MDFIFMGFGFWVCGLAVRVVLLPGRAFIETLIREDFREVIDVQAVAQAGADVSSDRGDLAVAIVVAGSRAMQHADGFDLASVQLDDFVAILCFSSVSVVHDLFCFWFVVPTMRRAP